VVTNDDLRTPMVSDSVDPFLTVSLSNNHIAPVGEKRATVASRIDNGVETGAVDLGEGKRRLFSGALSSEDMVNNLFLSFERIHEGKAGRQYVYPSQSVVACIETIRPAVLGGKYVCCFRLSTQYFVRGI
jgi:hypothetical protein